MRKLLNPIFLAISVLAAVSACRENDEETSENDLGDFPWQDARRNPDWENWKTWMESPLNFGGGDSSSSSSSSSSGGGAAGPSTSTPQDDPYNEPYEYATDLMLNAGCLINPPEIAVAQGHDTPYLCEHILAIPAGGLDGDYYEIPRYMEWWVLDESVLVLHCANGPNDDFCWATGELDAFDTYDGSEPSTVVVGCALNECPEPSPADCFPYVCNYVVVKSVVNLEGEWSFSGITFDEPSFAWIMQGGREFSGHDLSILKGSIVRDSVSFEIGDYLYEGTVSADRNVLEGQVIELMGYSVIGEWSAQRVP